MIVRFSSKYTPLFYFGVYQPICVCRYLNSSTFNITISRVKVCRNLKVGGAWSARRQVCTGRLARPSNGGIELGIPCIVRGTTVCLILTSSGVSSGDALPPDDPSTTEQGERQTYKAGQRFAIQVPAKPYFPGIRILFVLSTPINAWVESTLRMSDDSDLRLSLTSSTFYCVRRVVLHGNTHQA